VLLKTEALSEIVVYCK